MVRVWGQIVQKSKSTGKPARPQGNDYNNCATGSTSLFDAWLCHHHLPIHPEAGPELGNNYRVLTIGYWNDAGLATGRSIAWCCVKQGRGVIGRGLLATDTKGSLTLVEENDYGIRPAV